MQTKKSFVNRNLILSFTENWKINISIQVHKPSLIIHPKVYINESKALYIYDKFKNTYAGFVLTLV